MMSIVKIIFLSAICFFSRDARIIHVKTVEDALTSLEHSTAIIAFVKLLGQELTATNGGNNGINSQFNNYQNNFQNNLQNNYPYNNNNNNYNGNYNYNYNKNPYGPSPDPCSSSPCFNNAVCQPNGGESYYCLCKYGYYGNRCEKFNNPKGKLLAIILGTILPFFAIIIIISFIVFCCCNRRKISLSIFF
ncbi:zonadhesin [Brachionus plicatilis]|uniref:Zonadhesin n=1 Tax=Brachionus plicatilis TaxID=10195 RepID=A0A3M7RV53_BRAPC|nr:zonadhesin [Brachionus plicatilis]